jgi:predicted GNAT family N-acyltransferase
MSDLQIKVVTYTQELTAIQTIRRLVFQEEQGVSSELEFDGRDGEAEHLLAYLDGQPVGTARVRSLSQQIAKIERLAVLPSARGQGIARKLMETALRVITSKNHEEVVVNAQEYVKKFYEKLGFEQVGSSFEEAGIAHIKMAKRFGGAPM